MKAKHEPTCAERSNVATRSHRIQTVFLKRQHGAGTEGKSMNKWTRQGIQDLLVSNPKFVERSLRKLYECQTADERSGRSTTHSNGRGYNVHDAKFASSLVQDTLDKGRSLSERQLFFARRMLGKYAQQLANIANEIAEAKASPPVSAEITTLSQKAEALMAEVMSKHAST